jgi:CMP-N-acetylneuraminic acid synthetase
MKKGIVALIPARGGSKAVHRKNIQSIGTLPMMVYGITAAAACPLIEKVYVSSDDDEFLKIATLYGAIGIKRPEDLAQDDSTTESVVDHFLKNYGGHVIVLIQPTSPMILAEDLTGALKYFLKVKLTSLFSAVRTNDMLIWDEDAMYPINYDPRRRGFRQDRQRNILIENGAFFIFLRRTFEKAGSRICGKKLGYWEMPYWRSFQVDSKHDLQQVRTLMTVKGIEL